MILCFMSRGRAKKCADMQGSGVGDRDGAESVTQKRTAPLRH